MIDADALGVLVAFAREAAALVMREYATDFAVDSKGEDGPVTAADRLANALLCERLAARWPGVPVVAEESDASAFAGWASAERAFFVDPLDGTREFVEKNGQFVVMIGLAERGRATAGAIVAPTTDAAWAGVVGAGAWSYDATGARTPLRVSEVSALGEARAVVSRSHRSEALAEALAVLGAARVDALGSAGLKGAEVAGGRAEIYVAPGRAGKRWDACAVDALVTAAGGRMTDARGAPIDYASGSLDNEHGLVATNGRLHDEVLARIARASR